MDEKERERIREETRIRNSQTLKTSLKWLGIVVGILILGIAGCVFGVSHLLIQS